MRVCGNLQAWWGLVSMLLPLDFLPRLPSPAGDVSANRRCLMSLSSSFCFPSYQLGEVLRHSPSPREPACWQSISRPLSNKVVRTWLSQGWWKDVLESRALWLCSFPSRNLLSFFSCSISDRGTFLWSPAS